MSVPYDLIAVFVTFSVTYYVNEKRRLRGKVRQERLEEKRQQLLKTIRKRYDVEQENTDE